MVIKNIDNVKVILYPINELQTFLPFKSFEGSAKILDIKRLGKQRIECLQILNTLSIGPYYKYSRNLFSNAKSSSATEEEFKNPEKRSFGYNYKKTPWYNHPAVQMWKGYETALVEYGFAICREWKQRGYKDSCLEKIDSFDWNKEADTIYPPWLGNETFHLSHKSNLVRKKPEYYRPIFGKDIPDDLPYHWPTKNP